MDDEVVDFNMLCYGCNPNEFKMSVEDSFTFMSAGPAMVILSVLSDAQEELSRGLEDEARMTINRAKFLIGEYFMKDE